MAYIGRDQCVVYFGGFLVTMTTRNKTRTNYYQFSAIYHISLKYNEKNTKIIKIRIYSLYCMLICQTFNCSYYISSMDRLLIHGICQYMNLTSQSKYT